MNNTSNKTYFEILLDRQVTENKINPTLSYVVLIIFLIVIIVLVAEVFAYLWHRFMSHNEIIGPIHKNTFGTSPGRLVARGSL